MWCNQLVSLLARMLLTLPMGPDDLEAAKATDDAAWSAKLAAEESAVQQQVQYLTQLPSPEQHSDEQRRELEAVRGEFEQIRQRRAAERPALQMQDVTVRHLRRHLLGAEHGAVAAW